MRDLDGKTAVVTGGGSGIGRGTVLALADAGMHVVVADIDEQAAATVAGEVAERGVKGLPVTCDVSSRESVEALATAAYGEFGAVHVLHNNAGVATFVPLAEMTDEEWRWILSINLDGVINGIQAFLPRMRAQEGEKHVVNTASMAGLVASPMLGAYNATKYAVVAISETLREELAGEGFGVSVLCPGGVSTNIMANSLARRPGGADMKLPNFDAGRMRMMDPEEVGRVVRQAIVDGELYIFSHPEFKPAVEARFESIGAAFDRAAARAATPS